jgi:hypothetical protein
LDNGAKVAAKSSAARAKLRLSGRENCPKLALPDSLRSSNPFTLERIFSRFFNDSSQLRES